MIRRAAAAGALGILATLSITSCSEEQSSVAERRRALAERRQSEAEEAGWDQQAEVLADGEVTAAEYDALVASYIECYESEGVPMTDPVVHPANPRLRITAPENPGSEVAVDSEALVECQTTYLGVEELLWEDPAPMEPPLADAIRECMSGTGSPLEPDDDDLGDMARAVGPEGNDALARCVSEETSAFAPDLPAVSVSLPSIL